ncbi:MAG TPA: SDR family NAD(P)-dependent oxidoreductase [Euzebyales bacterium]|nr:SDR family NAD(P)-dependent oxidoreductase [Euzebyales bacterium]
MGELQDRVAVVTGAGRGIGRVVAETLAREGAHVVLAARSVDRLEETREIVESHGRTGLVVPTDLADRAQVAALAETAHDHFGAVDVLVNNSGIGGPSAPLWEVDPEEWEATLAVNVTGTFLACRALLPRMIERGSGNVVVVGSFSGKRPLRNRTAYTTSKMALVGMVRTLAVEVGPHGVRVNLVSPGAVQGERIEWVIGRLQQAHGISYEQARETLVSDSPFKRLIQPEEVAQAVVFLASDRSSPVTGEDLNVSAGAVMY